MLRPAERSAADRALVEDEAALLARVAAGDRGRPLEELYRRYEARLYGLGLRLLGDQGLAEELVQETFVRLWQQARASTRPGARLALPVRDRPSPCGRPVAPPILAAV